MFKLLIFALLIFLPSVLAFGPKGPKHQEEFGISEVKTCFDGYTLMNDGTCMIQIVEDPLPLCPEGQ